MLYAELKAQSSSHIVLLEEAEVADDADPDEQRGCSQQDTADIIVCQVLHEKKWEIFVMRKSFFHNPP